MKKNKKKNYMKQSASKRIIFFSIFQFFLIVFLSCYAIYTDRETSLFCYLIPSSAAILTGSIVFYYNKSKMENLSKQRIRYVYLKLLLENKIDPDTYLEIEGELCNIDEIINEKLQSSLSEAIHEDISTKE